MRTLYGDAVTLLFSLGNVQRLTGQFDAAIASYPQRAESEPGARRRRIIRSAKQCCSTAPRLPRWPKIQQEKSEVWRLIGLPMAYHALGRKTESDAALATLIAKDEKWGPNNIAYVYAFRGEADKAFEWLDKAVQYEDPGLIDIAAENLFDKIHGDWRWLPFLRKIGRAPEQLAKIQFKVTLPRQLPLTPKNANSPPSCSPTWSCSSCYPTGYPLRGDPRFEKIVASFAPK